jgi:hypothetical protein
LIGNQYSILPDAGLQLPEIVLVGCVPTLFSMVKTPERRLKWTWSKVPESAVSQRTESTSTENVDAFTPFTVLRVVSM